MFPASFTAASVNLNFENSEAAAPDNVSGPAMRFDDSDVARSLQYWYRKATLEVEKFVKGPKDYIKKVKDTYEAFDKIWNTVMLPRMIPQPKWVKDSKDLKPEDVVEDVTEVERIMENINRDKDINENRRIVQTENGGVMFVGSSFADKTESDCCRSGHHEMCHVPMSRRGAEIKASLASKMVMISSVS